ncbi:unnamed protein product, partial [Oppiella nova]
MLKIWKRLETSVETIDKTLEDGSQHLIQRPTISKDLTDATIDDNKYLDNHYKDIHNNTLPYQCDQCPKAYKDFSGFTEHKRTQHTSAPTYPCPYEGCSQMFRKVYHVKKHRELVHGLKPTMHGCCWPGCSYSTRDNDRLKLHVNACHTNVRPFVCEWPDCGKRFITQTKLNQHRNMHLKVKPGQQFCSSGTADYIFNFIDKDFYPNGILIKTNGQSVVFNDDLFDTSFTDLPKLLQKNDYVSGCGIKVIPKCKGSGEYVCRNNDKAIGLQILVTSDSKGSRSLVFERHMKPVADADLPFHVNDGRKVAFISRQWYDDLGQCAFLSTRFELIYATNKSQQIYWVFMNDTTVGPKWKQMDVPDIRLNSMFELKGELSGTADYIFNFIDKDFYPNGILIKTNGQSVVFNDDLFGISFTDLPKVLQKNDYVSGCGIKVIPKCRGTAETKNQCLNNDKSIGLQILVTRYPNGSRKHEFQRNGRPVPDADLPWDMGRCAYLSTRHELIYATKNWQQIYWFLLSETNRKWRHMSVPNVRLNSMFELKGEVYAVGRQ